MRCHGLPSASWADLRARYPQDFTVTPAQARAWRERQIAGCLKEGNLDAAQFHFSWLIGDHVLQSKPRPANP